VFIVVLQSRNTICWVTLVAGALLSASLSGQQPKRRAQPWIAPLLPAEQAWLITLPAEPAAGAAMDAHRVYLPLKAAAEREPALVPPPALSPTPSAGATPPTTEPAAGPVMLALSRETGFTEWTAPLSSALPPVVGTGVVYVALEREIRVLDAETGSRVWSVALEGAPREEMLLHGNLLAVLIEPDMLIGIRTDTRAVAWRRPIGEHAAVDLTADDRSVYVATASGRMLRILLHDGSIAWERKLSDSELSEPAVAEDRVLVGTRMGSSRAFFALDPGSGDVEWMWDARRMGGHPVGSAADDDVIVMAARDNVLRALNRGSGNQRWKQEIGTHAVEPPMAFGGIVVVTGINPTLSTFDVRTGAPISTWVAPANAELQGPPLIDSILRPFRTSIVVVLRDGRVSALRSTAMLFKEPALTPLTVLPGRPLQREVLPVKE
jgi:hypothetical protein